MGEKVQSVASCSWELIKGGVRRVRTGPMICCAGPTGRAPI